MATRTDNFSKTSSARFIKNQPELTVRGLSINDHFSHNPITTPKAKKEASPRRNSSQKMRKVISKINELKVKGQLMGLPPLGWIEREKLN